MNHYQPQNGPQGFITTENESIYFESYGQGETVILCHGLGGNHAIWYQQVPVLARHYRVITWDQRGFGRSSNHAGQAGPPAATRDLSALCDHLEVDQAHLIGQSMGGWAVLGFALSHPKRTHSLVLADTIAGIYTPAIAAAYDAYNQIRPAPQDLSFGQHPAIGLQLTQQDPARAFLYNQIGSVAEPPPVQMLTLLRNTAYSLEAINKLDLPAMFVVGSDDPIFAPATIRQASVQLRNSRVVEIPNTGHSPYFEMPLLWNEAVLNFLKDAGSI
jgi:2-succinyl-6-hydroxy-2,4-cyclohexadiene-1-carboxylate synthase